LLLVSYAGYDTSISCLQLLDRVVSFTNFSMSGCLCVVITSRACRQGLPLTCHSLHVHSCRSRYTTCLLISSPLYSIVTSAYEGFPLVT
jgi:hypothetical protein